MPSISPKYVDRLIGFAVSLVGGASLYRVHSWLTSMTFRENEFSLNTFCGMTAPKSREGEYFRNMKLKRHDVEDKVVHTGSCHCGGFRFRVLASDVINVVDYSTKIRFPRLTIQSEELEVLRNSSLSRYAVTDGNQSGTHSFCSSCGMQVMYSPSPLFGKNEEVVINVDCLDRSTVRQVNVSYGGKWNMFPSLASLQLPDNLQMKDRCESCETDGISDDDESDDFNPSRSASGGEASSVMDLLLQDDDIEEILSAVNNEENPHVQVPPDDSVETTDERLPLFNTLSLLYVSDVSSRSLH
jgi:hypothetical protein